MSSSDSHERSAERAALTPTQVKALLMVALQSRSPSGNPPGSALEAVEQLLAKMQPTAGSGTDVLERAAHEATPVAELIRIKDLAKTLIVQAPDSRHREAARLLYHVAVAAAFVHRGVAISSRPIRKQQFLYERFAEKWAEHPIGRLFREAANRAIGAEPHHP